MGVEGKAPEMFVCRRCGNCCRAAGDVRLQAGDIEAIARLLGLDPYAFTARYTSLGADRRGLALAEQADGACVFLTETNTCRIQAAKPAQCRGYPQAWRHAALDSGCAARPDAARSTNAQDRLVVH
jgi:Fe-S-cluster containining protein